MSSRQVGEPQHPCVLAPAQGHKETRLQSGWRAARGQLRWFVNPESCSCH